MTENPLLAEEELPPEFASLAPDAAVAADDGDNSSLQSQYPEASEPPDLAGVFGAPSGLHGRNLTHARDMAMQAAFLGLHHRSSVHYTEGAARWDGIDHYRRAWRGDYPRYADCSAFVTWCLWQALLHYHKPDVVNGQHFKAGYTGTMLGHGTHIHHNLMRGDAVIYGRGFPGAHTALYVGSGKVISHGSERGPLLLSMYYRSDVLAIRRYL